MGMTEVVLIFVVALVVLGPDRVPGLAKAIGRAMREFRKATREIQTTLRVEEVRRSLEEQLRDEVDAAEDRPAPRPAIAPPSNTVAAGGRPAPVRPENDGAAEDFPDVSYSRGATRSPSSDFGVAGEPQSDGDGDDDAQLRAYTEGTDRGDAKAPEDSDL